MIPIPKYDKTRSNNPHSVEDYRAQAPCWVPIVWYSNEKPTRPILVCNCGNPIGLTNHSIAADGTVSASWYHKKGNGKHEDPNGCEWHVFIKLADWDGRVFPRLGDNQEDPHE